MRNFLRTARQNSAHSQQILPLARNDAAKALAAFAHESAGPRAPRSRLPHIAELRRVTRSGAVNQGRSQEPG